MRYLIVVVVVVVLVAIRMVRIMMGLMGTRREMWMLSIMPATHWRH